MIQRRGIMQLLIGVFGVSAVGGVASVGRELVGPSLPDVPQPVSRPSWWRKLRDLVDCQQLGMQIDAEIRDMRSFDPDIEAMTSVSPVYKAHMQRRRMLGQQSSLKLLQSKLWPEDY